jgi:ATPase subunit of ABC transporter with duplicated ATPase domains
LRAFGGGYAAWAEAEEAEAERRRTQADHAKAALARVTRHTQEVRERQARRDARGVRERDTGSQSKLLLNAHRERSEGTGARLHETATRLEQDAREQWRQARAALDERDPIHIVLPSATIPAGTRVVQCTDVAIDAAPGVPLLRHVSFTLRGAARVAFTGPNGAGKSTLMRVLLGEHAVANGTVYHGLPRCAWVWLDQQTWRLTPEHTVLEAHAAAQHWTGEHAEGQARALLAHFGFRGDQASRRIRTLSGGERVRAALACALGVLSDTPAPRCLVLDEPTNHLDLESLTALEQALRSWTGALLVVSHDARFLEALGISTVYPLANWR